MQKASASIRYLCMIYVEMFYLNANEQLFLFVEQVDQFEVCQPYSRLLTGIPMLAVFQNLRLNNNEMTLHTYNSPKQIFDLRKDVVSYSNFHMSVILFTISPSVTDSDQFLIIRSNA